MSLETGGRKSVAGLTLGSYESRGDAPLAGPTTSDERIFVRQAPSPQEDPGAEGLLSADRRRYRRERLHDFSPSAPLAAATPVSQVAVNRTRRLLRPLVDAGPRMRVAWPRRAQEPWALEPGLEEDRSSRNGGRTAILEQRSGRGSSIVLRHTSDRQTAFRGFVSIPGMGLVRGSGCVDILIASERETLVMLRHCAAVGYVRGDAD
jgi:hypothetical protein